MMPVRHFGFLALFAMFFGLFSPLLSQSIEEKKQALSGGVKSLPSSDDGQTKLFETEQQLSQIYEQAAILKARGAPASEYAPLYDLAKNLHLQWQLLAKELLQASGSGESEAIWHLPDATVKQLVVDFGGSDAIYLIPDDIAQRKVSIVSSLSLPRQNWPAMLDLILSQMGIGVRQINPFCKELFASGVAEGFNQITDKREELWLIPDSERVCFILEEGPMDTKQFARSLIRLVDPANTQIKSLGSKLAIIAPAIRVRQLLQIYDFMARTEKTKAYRIVSLSRLSAEDIQKMLSVIFAQTSEPSKPETDLIGLQVFPIQYDQRAALFVSGSDTEVKRAVDLIAELENQIEMSSGKRLFWYTAKHSSAEELSKVLSKVYRLLVQEANVSDDGKMAGQNEIRPASEGHTKPGEGNISPLVVSPDFVGASSFDKATVGVHGDGQIVVDAQSGALIMVVEPAILPKLKDLLAKLDMPKKMVRVDFLLFEKKVTDQTQFGLEQLKLGSAASRTNTTGFGYSDGILTNPTPVHPISGINHFFASHHGVPSFDLAYNFLLSQESIQINANPSVLTVNGTQTVVNLVDEISINTGAMALDNNNTTFKDSYSRAQYGITLKVTPTVHEGESPYDPYTVALETDINFDTPSSLTDTRPTVARRAMKNLVKVADGQTVVLGGLRQKTSDDSQTGLPFLGDIPGFGKFFSYSASTDVTKEMFVFITPRVVEDSGEEYQKLILEDMKRRPGEGNEFLIAFEESRINRKSFIFEKSIEAILGHDRSTSKNLDTSRARGEYDGRN